MSRVPREISMIFAGGGTGGHLYPAIAIANRIKELLEPETKVNTLFIGTKRGLEYQIRDSLGYPLKLINIRGIARSFTPKNLLVPFLVVGALLKAKSIINEAKPDVVIGTGGYVAWPVLKIAASKNIITLLQEQNSFPGITTRQLAGKAKKVYLGFDEAKKHLPANTKTKLTGNPVRRDIAYGEKIKSLEKYNLDKNKKTILILGGSQGARAINEAVLKSLGTNDLDENYQLLWQTGKRDYKDVVTQVGEKHREHSLFPFAHDMKEIYATSDLVIARAGAITLAELQACNLPSILIPFPFAAGDHQLHNANSFIDYGYAKLIDQSNLGDKDILQIAVDMINSGEAKRMNQKMIEDSKDKKPAVDLIAEDIINLVINSQEAAIAS